MATAGKPPRKKIIHAYDPLDDWPEEVHEEPGHVRYILRGNPEIEQPGYWADWAVQTTNLKKLSDKLEEHIGERFVTISAVIFDEFGTSLLVSDKDGYRHTVDLDEVRVEGIQTTRL